jgi:hypothetical protein
VAGFKVSFWAILGFLGGAMGIRCAPVQSSPPSFYALAVLESLPNWCRISAEEWWFSKKDSLEHLPERKREELRRLAETIRGMCNDVEMIPDLGSRFALFFRAGSLTDVRDRIAVQGVFGVAAGVAGRGWLIGDGHGISRCQEKSVMSRFVRPVMSRFVRPFFIERNVSWVL